MPTLLDRMAWLIGKLTHFRDMEKLVVHKKIYPRPYGREGIACEGFVINKVFLRPINMKSPYEISIQRSLVSKTCKLGSTDTS